MYPLEEDSNEDNICAYIIYPNPVSTYIKLETLFFKALSVRRDYVE